MTNTDDRRPFSQPYVTQTSIPGTSGTLATMVARAPWPGPVNKYFVLRKLLATANVVSNLSGTVLNVWDQDLSNTTPVARGSAGGPLMQIPLAQGNATLAASGLAATMTVLDIDACPQQYFQAGLTVAVNSAAISGNTIIMAELDVI